LVLAVAAVAVAVRRRTTILRMALGGSIAVVVFLIALALARNDFVSTAMKKSLNSQTAGIIFDTLLRYLKDGLWISLAVLLVLSVILWFIGRRSRRRRTPDLTPTVGSLPAEETVAS
jgi:membrane protein implicated in regulation of membrane protease activity